MGYWVRGKVEGTVKVDFQMVVRQVALDTFEESECSELVKDMLEESGDLYQIGGVPLEWWTGDWRIDFVEASGAGATPDFDIGVTFVEVEVPFEVEGWEEKITCLDEAIGFEAKGRRREIERDLECDGPDGCEVTVRHLVVDATFDGVGEDGEPRTGVKLWSNVAVPH